LGLVGAAPTVAALPSIARLRKACSILPAPLVGCFAPAGFQSWFGRSAEAFLQLANDIGSFSEDPVAVLLLAPF